MGNTQTVVVVGEAADGVTRRDQELALLGLAAAADWPEAALHGPWHSKWVQRLVTWDAKGGHLGEQDRACAQYGAAFVYRQSVVGPCL